MSTPRAFVTGIGVITPAGVGLAAMQTAIMEQARCLRPLTRFAASEKGAQLVGEIPERLWAPDPSSALPRTHQLAVAAAHQALGDRPRPVDAVVLGGTTGGMPTTEALLFAGCRDAAAFALHGVGTVADSVARSLGLTCPTFTVSTACSSGAVALTIALELIRSDQAARVLAGGADALCQLTYFGFGMLQLIDPAGCRPLDLARAGMSVGEGCALLVLEAGAAPPYDALAELVGAGLSCDAHHVSAPHPEGRGAAQAIARALEDGSVAPEAVDYINLHGTGTRDNDPAEIRGVKAVFGSSPPLLSSTKGTLGHSLAAAGAVEAALAVLCIDQGLVPANVGLATVDPELDVEPVRVPRQQSVDRVLSNSFGFGGNNAALLFAASQTARRAAPRASHAASTVLQVLSYGVVTRAGLTPATLAELAAGRSVAGLADEPAAAALLPRKNLRRLSRLARLALGAAHAAVPHADSNQSPQSVFFGTAWGALTPTADFLTQLFESTFLHSSPTDFVGSVHNAVAGQLAIQYQATGANVTATSGNVSFEQAAQLCQLLGEPQDSPCLLLGADEHHATLTPLLDPSSAASALASDGAAAFLVRPVRGAKAEPDPFRDHAGPDPARAAPFDGDRRPAVALRSHVFGDLPQAGAAIDREATRAAILGALDGLDRLGSRFAALWVSIPAAETELGETQLAAILQCEDPALPVVRYRPLIGEHGSAAAIATALAVMLCEQGTLPATLTGANANIALDDRGILMLALGRKIAALEVLRGAGC